MDVQVGTLWVTVPLAPMKLPSVPGAAAMAALICRTRVNSGPVSSGGRLASVRFFSRGDRAENAVVHTAKITSQDSAVLRLCTPL